MSDRPASSKQAATGDPRRPKKGHGAKSDAVREQAVLALLSEPTLERAAARAGIGQRTLRRWLTEDAAFQTEYATARRATFEAGISRVASLTVRAVETLEDLLGDARYPAVRLGAARTIAEIGMNRNDAETILRKLDQLEAAHQRRRDK